MAKKAYVGVNSIARKVKKIYVGVGGVARKVKKGYIGVNGVARLFFKFGELVYHAKYVQRTIAAANDAGAANSNYAFVAEDNNVMTFNRSLVCSNASNLSTSRSNMEAAPVGQYVIFGPSDKTYSSPSLNADVYDASATRASTFSFPSTRYQYSSIYNDNYAIFGPGAGQNTGQTDDSTVNLIDSTLTMSLTSASGHYINYCVSTNGKYAILLGGSRYVYSNSPYWLSLSKVNAIDLSGTVINLTDLATPLENAAGARAGEYALCGGGAYKRYTSSAQTTKYTTVATYNQSLTRSSASSLSSETTTLSLKASGASADEYGILPSKDYYDAFDSSLVKQVFSRTYSLYTIPNLAISFNGMALFCIGQMSSSTDVDVFAVE